MVPRALGTQLVAERPDEVLMIHYIKLGASKSGFTQALLLMDKFTRFGMFVSTVTQQSGVCCNGSAS